MKRISSLMAVLLMAATPAAADVPDGPARLDGHWKLDWDQSDSMEVVMKALETPWLIRRLAGVARVGLELRAIENAEDCDSCPARVNVTLSSPISTNEVEAILDGEPRPGADPRGRPTVDRYRWSSEAGLEMIRELELPSGSQARLRETRDLGPDSSTLLSTLTVWVDESEMASIQRVFTRADP